MVAMFSRALVAWLLLLALAIFNGAFRQGVLAPRLGDQIGHVLSSLLLATVILVAGWLLLPWIGASSLREAYSVGSLWLLLTVAFEFLAGHYLFGQSWERLLADYNLFSGRIWVLVLLCTFLSPVIASLARR